MPAKLGGVFITCAMGPLHFAGACIQGGKMPEALKELAPEGLWSGMQRGVEQTARLAGVRTRDVEGLLPMLELRAAADQLSLSHRVAQHAWGVHAGQLGGLLRGLTDLTIDGRPPDPSVSLMRVARKVSRDKALAVPLQNLSDDVARWHELIVRCRALLDEEGGGLGRAYRRRRLLQLGAAAVLSLGIAGALGYAVVVQKARARVDAALALADPCVAREVRDADLDRSSGAQRSAVADRRRACDDLVARQGREREEQRRREEQQREEERRRAEMDARCEGLAGRLQGGRGQLSAEDEALAGRGAELLHRIARKELLPADLGPEGPELPCAGVKGGERILAAFADAAVASAWRWVTVADPSERARAALAARGPELPERARGLVGVRALETAKRGITAGDPESIARGLRLCDFADALGSVTGQPCAALRELAAKKP